MPRLLFITGNEGKLAEARAHFSQYGWSVEKFLVDGKVPELVEPQADSLEEVAEAKLKQALELLGGSVGGDAVLVEDSGLFITSQGGFPGIYSAPILSQIGLHGVLRLMAGESERSAEFRASVALYHRGDIIICRGVCRGHIAEEVRGEGGFGYDPLFVPEGGDGRTFAEMNAGEKGELSHRGHALRELERVFS